MLADVAFQPAANDGGTVRPGNDVVCCSVELRFRLPVAVPSLRIDQGSIDFDFTVRDNKLRGIRP